MRLKINVWIEEKGLDLTGKDNRITGFENIVNAYLKENYRY